jgi:hypothetical protein
VVIGTGIFSVLGIVSIVLAMVILGHLSKRLGAVTHTPRYYIGFYGAAALMGISAVVRLLDWLRGVDLSSLNSDPGWILLYIGLPALAVTLAVITAWRYWSWLLAERG